MHIWRISKLVALSLLAAGACRGDITTSPSITGLPLGLTGATAVSRWVGATTTLPPVSGTFAVGDYVTTRDGNIYICTVAGSPGTWRAPNAQVLLGTDGFTLSNSGSNITFASGVTGFSITGGAVGATLGIGSSVTFNGAAGAVMTLPSVNSTLASTAYVDSAIAAIPECPLVLFTHLIRADSSSTDGSTDVLFTDTILASTLNSDGDKLVESELVTTVGSATASRRIKKYFDGTLIWDSGALTLALGTSFWINTTIYRTGPAEAVVVVAVTTTSASTVPYVTLTTVTTAFSGDIILKTSAIASGTGAASADISNKVAHITFLPSGTAE